MDKFDLLATVRLIVNVTIGSGAFYVTYLLAENKDEPLIRRLMELLVGIAIYNLGAGGLFVYQGISGVGFSLSISAGYVAFNAFEAIAVARFVWYMLQGDYQEV